MAKNTPNSGPETPVTTTTITTDGSQKTKKEKKNVTVTVPVTINIGAGGVPTVSTTPGTPAAVAANTAAAAHGAVTGAPTTTPPAPAAHAAHTPTTTTAGHTTTTTEAGTGAPDHATTTADGHDASHGAGTGGHGTHTGATAAHGTEAASLHSAGDAPEIAGITPTGAEATPSGRRNPRRIIAAVVLALAAVGVGAYVLNSNKNEAADQKKLEDEAKKLSDDNEKGLKKTIDMKCVQRIDGIKPTTFVFIGGDEVAIDGSGKMRKATLTPTYHPLKKTVLTGGKISVADDAGKTHVYEFKFKDMDRLNSPNSAEGEFLVHAYLINE